MKKISLIALLFSIVILSGCGKITQSEIALKECETPYLEGGVTQKLIENTPDCTPEKLKDIEIINIDNIARNCTSKEKNGDYYQEKSRGPGYKYKIFNNQILTYDESKYIPQTVICKYKLENNEYEFYSRFKPGTGLDCKDVLYTQDFDKSQYEIMNTLVGKGIVDEIVTNTSEPKREQDALYELCGLDESCRGDDINDMLDYGDWTDGQNYFIAGYRNKQLLYIINDKIYNPGEDVTSKRYFAGIKNNKIIVKGIKNVKIEENIDSKTSFTLETCEIDL